MSIVDQEVTSQRNTLTTQNKELKSHLEKAINEGNQLRGLLEAAAKSDARSEALLREMKVHYATEQNSIATERKLLEQKKEEVT
jgi:predicted RNA-binding protein